MDPREGLIALDGKPFHTKEKKPAGGDASEFLPPPSSISTIKQTSIDVARCSSSVPPVDAGP
jgi:hypothetical protein